jgi:glycosyltransferase involved in cell wall biosynthesis
MKILFITRYYYPHIGGVEKHVAGISDYLIKKGNKVTIVTEKYSDELKYQEEIKGANIIRFNYPKIKFLGLFFIWLFLFKNRRLIESADIIHCHDVFIWYLPFRFLYPSKPVYTTFHGWEGIYPIPFKNILIKRLSAKLSRGNICVGEYIEKFYGIKANSITYGGVDVPPRHNLKKIAKSLVYVGRLEKDTDFDKSIQVIKVLKGWRIDFCGNGKFAQECSKYGTVHGWSDPTSYYAKAKFCFALGYLSILEGLINKCIVIAFASNITRLSYLKELPFPKLPIVRSPSEAIKRINYYLDNPGITITLIDEGFEWAKGQTWNKLTNQYLNLWDAK